MAQYVKFCDCGAAIMLASDNPNDEITASYSQVGDKLYIICPYCKNTAEIPPDMFPYKEKEK